jgi:hypothetical protein
MEIISKSGNYFKLVGNNIIPIKSTYELGSTTEKIAKIWVEDIVVGGLIDDGDIDLDGNDILNVKDIIGETGQVIGIGSEIELLNDKWLLAKDTTTGIVNMFKVNANNTIQSGAGIEVNGTIEAPEDAGAITLFDMPVSDTPDAGTEMSATIKIDGDNILKVYAEADGSGGLQNIRLIASGDLHILAKNIVTDTTTGTKIGTATGQKLGFYNATPVIQPTAVADAAGGDTVDAEARTALNGLLAKLRTLGIIAT